MQIIWRSILPAFLIVVISIFVAIGEVARTQNASSGAASTKHDAAIQGLVASANGKHLCTLMVRAAPSTRRR